MGINVEATLKPTLLATIVVVLSGSPNDSPIVRVLFDFFPGPELLNELNKALKEATDPSDNLKSDPYVEALKRFTFQIGRHIEPCLFGEEIARFLVEEHQLKVRRVLTVGDSHDISNFREFAGKSWTEIVNYFHPA